MPEYRLYRMDSFSGHITSVEEFHAADPVSAVYEMQHRTFDCPVEIWVGGHKLARIDVRPEGANFLAELGRTSVMPAMADPSLSRQAS